MKNSTIIAMSSWIRRTQRRGGGREGFREGIKGGVKGGMRQEQVGRKDKMREGSKEGRERGGRKVDQSLNTCVQAWPTANSTDYCTKAGLLQGGRQAPCACDKINIP